MTRITSEWAGKNMGRVVAFSSVYGQGKPRRDGAGELRLRELSSPIAGFVVGWRVLPRKVHPRELERDEGGDYFNAPLCAGAVPVLLVAPWPTRQPFYVPPERVDINTTLRPSSFFHVEPEIVKQRRQDLSDGARKQHRLENGRFAKVQP